MKTPKQAVEFIQYVEKQSRACAKYEGFVLQDWLNDVLQANEGYEDYFIVIHQDREQPENVRLYRYSNYRSSDTENNS